MATQPALQVDKIWLTGPGRHTFCLKLLLTGDFSGANCRTLSLLVLTALAARRWRSR